MKNTFKRLRQFRICGVKAVLLVASSSAVPLAAHAAESDVWQGSYAADGQCFCSGEIPDSIASKIVPTPVGGQTVAQVCSRLGSGPGLERKNGLFNHTVYPDLQCGHGPALGLSDSFDANEDVGPKWSLAAAYTPPSTVLAAAEPEPVLADEPQEAALAAKDQSVPEALEANKAESADDRLASFKGRTVTLGNDRYLQARDDLPANGGVPGSRIILDGLVFLREDESLDFDDLYSEVDVVENTAPESPISAVTGDLEKPDVDKEITELANKARVANDTAQSTNGEETERQHQIALQAEREERARKAFAAEQAEKSKRLALQKQKAEQRKLAEREERARKAFAAEQAEKSKRLALQKQKTEQKKLAEQRASKEKARIVREQQASSDKASAQAKSSSTLDAISEVSEQAKVKTDTGLASVISALRLPANARASSRNFDYLEAVPTTYDFGGAGVQFEGSFQHQSRFQLVGRAGVSDTYSEVMVGGGYYVTPKAATRMTVVLLAGIESGSFEITDENLAPGLTVTSADTGLFLGALSRVVINSKFELKGGMGYSSFFDGDLTIFGGGYYHITPRLDVLSRFEFGDNDNLGIGIRYFY